MKTYLSIIVGLLSVCAACAEDAPTLLKIKWPVGKKLSQTMEMNQTTTIPMGDQKMEQGSKMTQESSMSITAHEGKKKMVMTKYGRIAMDINMMGQKMNFDSDKPDAAGGPMASLGKLVGLEFGFVVDENEEIGGFVGVDKLLEAVGGGNPMVAGMINEDALEQTIQQGMIQAMPEKPEAIGDEWPFEMDMAVPQVGKMEIKGVYKLTGWENVGGAKCAVIDINAGFEIDKGEGAEIDDEDEAAKMMKALGVEMKNGKMAGTYWFDNDLGMSRKSVIDTDMALSMKNPQTGEGMNMPIKQKVTVTVDKVEDL